MMRSPPYVIQSFPCEAPKDHRHPNQNDPNPSKNSASRRKQGHPFRMTLLSCFSTSVQSLANARTTIATQKMIQAVRAMPAMEIFSGSIIGS